jgi:hypothetical protein
MQRSMNFVPKSIHKQKGTHFQKATNPSDLVHTGQSIKDGLIGLELEASALSRYSSRLTAVKRSSSGGGRQDELEHDDCRE